MPEVGSWGGGLALGGAALLASSGCAGATEAALGIGLLLAGSLGAMWTRRRLLSVAAPLAPPALEEEPSPDPPAAPLDPPAPPPTVRAPPAARATSTRPRLLVAEDNAVNQLVASRLLERLGGEVIVVGSGAETVAVRAREQVDLVFMDCAMPEVDGFEATRRIRAWERASGVPPVPIVAMTANVMPGITEACAEAGMNDYVAKPVSLATLDATLTRWCGARQASAVMMRATRS